MSERIVITGMGTVNPLGLCMEETWKKITSGVSGVAPITLFDATNFAVKVACEVKNFNPENYMPAKDVRRRDRFQILAAAAGQEAIRQANLVVSEEDAWRVGVVFSTSIGGIKTIQDSVITMMSEGARRISAFAITQLMPNGAAGLTSIDHHYRGPSFSVASACASSADAIGVAWMMLKAGMIDVAVAGGTEATITPIGVGSFDRLGAMTHEPINETGVYHTPRPFDLNREGLVMGEGAAALVLERESHAKARGAEILAELAGYGSTSDAFHVTAPIEDGSGGAQAIRLALQSAGASLQDVGYINAHGTATGLNDASETRAIKAVFGDLAYNIPVSSTKSMTGHMMGATGALEAILCAQVVREGILPPTINYETPDPVCDLDYVPNQARYKEVHTAISNAFGFGGHNAVLVIRRG